MSVRGSIRGRPGRASRATGLVLAALAAAAIVLTFASGARAEAGPWWHLYAAAVPTYLPPGGVGEVEVMATNVGDAYVKAGETVTVSDKVPTALKAIEISGETTRETHAKESGEGPMECPTKEQLEQKQSKGESLGCTYNHKLAPYESLRVTIKVHVEEPLGTETTLPNEATVQGGGAPALAPLTRRLTVNGATTPFGVTRFEMTPEEEGGAVAPQAGSHPLQLTTTLDLNLTREKWPFVSGEGTLPSLPALPRDFTFKLPPGMLANPTAVPKCSDVEFASVASGINRCPANTVLGVAVIHINEPKNFREFTLSVPVYNLNPSPGEPARFGFFAAHALVFIETAVRSDEEYAATASVHNATQAAEVLSSVVTLWGDPGSAVHDSARGWQCVEGEQHDEFNGKHCESLEEAKEERPKTAFLLFPTACSGPLHTTLEADSWPTPAAPNGFTIPSQAALITPPEGLGGCNALPFAPEISVQPEQSAEGPPTLEGSTPTGMKVDVHVPQQSTLAPTGLSESAVNATTVTLPEGLLLNPGAANGLLTCSTDQVGLKPSFESAQSVTENNGFTAAAPGCPAAAKVGTVTIKTPLLDHEIEGAVYLANQDTNPFAPPLVMYLIVNDEADGVLVKLAGSVTPNPETGQLSSTFKNTPQLPFEELKLHFLEGGRASLSTPGPCGTYTTTSSFTPWSGNPPANPTGSFAITSGPGGTPCANPLPLAPTLKAGSESLKPGQFTNFAVTITRPDGDQAIDGLTVKLPTGLAGVLANVTPCPEPQADNGTCGPESLIGHASTSSGLGSEPFTLTGGSVYLTVGYGGAPFGLAIVFSNIEAGPFHLGTVVVRSGIFVDPYTAAVTIRTTVPTFLETIPGGRKGVPVQLKQTSVETLGQLPNGKGFQFNPTNCTPMKIEATFHGDQGGLASAASPFQLANCASLPFKPTLEARTEAKTSKLEGASLVVRVTSSGLGVANIAKTKVALPIALPSRLTTIQKACIDKVFEANPGSCPEGSNIGTAIIHTPVFKNPLKGPAFLVSHGNVSFPDVEFVLKGEGLTIILDGKTDIKKGITTSTFEALPDAPFTEFETVLPRGPHSALAANGNLCSQKLLMPTTITAQNGAVINQTTKIGVRGCPKAATRAQLLAKALKACRKHHKKKKKRLACERAARKKYGPKKTAKHKHR